MCSCVMVKNRVDYRWGGGGGKIDEAVNSAAERCPLRFQVCIEVQFVRQSFAKQTKVETIKNKQKIVEKNAMKKKQLCKTNFY